MSRHLFQSIEKEISPKIKPGYDPHFLPLGKFLAWYQARTRNSQQEFRLALERENRLVSTW
ncbi:MAG: hypothetical protein NUW07_05250, partial [Candidatus Saccharicenans sp.]|nr:hypothetical protein [Candidatus Saccharicenans sp.]